MAKTTRDYRADVSWETAKKLLEFAERKGCPIDSFVGTLLDNYVIYNTKCMTINKVKPREYIILKEKYLNAWSSGIEITMTDDYSKVEAFIEGFDDYED